MILISTIATFFLLQLVFAQDESCNFNVASSSLLVITDKFKIPFDGTLELYQFERFFVRCPPGMSNPHLDEDGEQISCEANTTVRVDRINVMVEFEDLECSNALPVVVQKTNNNCTEGVEVVVGVEVLKKMYPVYTVCFDDKVLVPLSITFPEEVQWSDPSNEKHFFVDSGNSYGDVKVDELYQNQKDIFEKLGLPDVITKDVYLDPTPLLSNKLFPYSLINEAVFDYVAVVPQWNSLQSVFSKTVLDYLTTFNYTDLSVGTSEVATLSDSDNHVIELYLSDRKAVPVPRWLTVTLTANNASATIFGYNNPVFNETEVTEELNKKCQSSDVLSKEKMFVASCLLK